MKLLLICCSLFVMISCEKSALTSVNTDLVGNWRHHSGANDYHEISIDKAGQGTIAWAVADKVVKKTKIREWFLDDDILRFGKTAFNGEQYTINKYPKMTWVTLIKYYDTIAEGKRYIVLDDKYYAEI